MAELSPDNKKQTAREDPDPRSKIAEPDLPIAAWLDEGESGDSPLHKFIPRELLDKLEAARESGSMARERRIVSMLFCDVQGSTAAAENLDPEEWTEIINGAFEHMIKPVYRYEGTLARLMGDAILAFFGAPIAHEDDPERAVMAGLEIVSGIQTYRESVLRDHGIELNVRVGIHTGMVVVGHVGSDLRMEYTAMGDAINLAARMEQSAPPGGVQISADTHQKVAHLFEFEELGEIPVKGKSAPISTYRVIRPRSRSGEAHRILRLDSPLVGRGQELSELEDSLARLRRGIGGLLFLIGQAGLGKSRLIQEARARLDAGDRPAVEWHETTCLSFERAQPYSLFRHWLGQRIGAAPSDRPDQLRLKIDRLSRVMELEGSPSDPRVWESLFGLPGRSGEEPLAGDSFKQLFRAATLRLWRHQVSRSPAVLVCDDLHWADSASIELLEQLFTLTEKVPLLVICSFRPERRSPAWGLKSRSELDYHHRYTELRLRPLSAQQSAELLENLTSHAALPDALRRSILVKSAGIPFYIEQVLVSLIESRALQQHNGHLQWVVPETLDEFELPDNLQSLLVARMDRLPEQTRRTLQVASVIGRAFHFRVLQQVRQPAEGIEQQLGQLLRADLIRELGREPELEYTFSNVLAQEAIYQTLLLRHRRILHRQVGLALETLFPERREELAPVLALHFEEAADPDRTLIYRKLAADTAFRLFGMPEAVLHYAKALEAAERGQADLEVRADLYLRLGRALELNGEYRAALDNYREMDSLADQQANQVMKLRALVAIGTILTTANEESDMARGERLMARALDLARQLGDEESEARIQWNLMNVFRLTHRAQEALEAGERSLELASKLDLKEQIGYTTNDLGYAYSGRGDVERVLQMWEQAIPIWRELNNLPMLTDSLSSYAGMLINIGDIAGAMEIYEEALEIGKTLDNPWARSYALFVPVVAYFAQMRISQALAAADECISLARQVGFVGGIGIMSCVRAQLYLELGDAEQARQSMDGIRGLLERKLPLFLATAVGTEALISIRCDLLDNAAASLHAFEDQGPPYDLMNSFNMEAAQCEYLLHMADYPQAERLASSIVADLHQRRIALFLPRFLVYQAQALLALGKAQTAWTRLSEAQTIAEQHEIRAGLWQIFALKAEIAESRGQEEIALQLRQRMKAVIDWIVSHTEQPDLVASFLKQLKTEKEIQEG